MKSVPPGRAGHATSVIPVRVLGADRHLEHWIVGHRTGVLDPVFVGLSWAGRLGAVWLAVALVLAWQRRNPGLFATVLVADVAADLLADAGKAIVPRHRPDVHRLGPPESTHSFPSGHSATSFACALVLGAAAPRLRVPLYLLATAIAYSRLYDGDHYPLDVVAGAVLGTATALLLLAAGRRRSHPGSRSG